MSSDKSLMGQEMKNSLSGKNLKLWAENKIQQKIKFPNCKESAKAAEEIICITILK